MTPLLLDPTFRDPAGSLVLEQDQAVRNIHPESRMAVQQFIDSAFYCRLVERGDVVAVSGLGKPGFECAAAAAAGTIRPGADAGRDPSSAATRTDTAVGDRLVMP